ncbi:uncharacterized protein LOC113206932 [Frankliniella occidentalis]|uniref:Uncharacterized protein LOC113206932 n=1 Tax=Frankliniella occidentalis TaxID=133901 RepID=A0A9C6U2I8_FRAOC|nr:uncharacterized protein LOC113206932 [Frankliniella occidentalis]
MRARLPRLLLAALCCALCPRPALCATAAAAEPFDTRQVALDEADRIPGLGSLRGSRTQSYWKRRPVYQYQAIPYAEPTSGPKRFLPPEPAAPWTGVLDATALGRRCPQEWEPLSKQTAAPPEPPGGDIEDCLTLNVYAPVRPSTRCDRLLPVMFYIHGGSWRVGSAKDFAPHYLLDRDVLLVVIQYRLGVFEIKRHVVHRGALTRPRGPFWASLGAVRCGPEHGCCCWCLYMAQKQDLAAGGRATGAGGNHAVVQKAGAQRFLVEHPRHSLRLGRHKRLPVMGGVTKHEGSFFFGNIYDIFLDGEGRMEDADYLRHNLTKVTLEFSGIDDDTGALSDVFREKYFKESDLGNFTLMTPGLIDICGVALLKACTFRMVQENSRLAPSYLYSFNFKGRHTKFGYGYSFLYPFSGGVAHSDDLIYLFPDGDLNEEEDATARTMVDLWTNFATFGAPAPAYRVPEWPAVSTEHGPYLRIGREPQVRDNFLDEYHIAVQEGLDAAPHVSGTFATCVIAALFTLAASL